MAEEGMNNLREEQKQKNLRDSQNNANTIYNAGHVLKAIPNPVTKAIGTAIHEADKYSDGKSTAALGKITTGANKVLPGGRTVQKTSNILGESGINDKVGQAASIYNKFKNSNSSKTPDKKAASSGEKNKSGDSKASKASDKKSPSSGEKNNSGFENSKSGLFSPKSKVDKKQSGSSSNGSDEGFKDAKKIIKFIGLVSFILFPLLICAVVAFVVMGQIMITIENIQDLALKVDTGIEKTINFVQGDGWMTKEESFFNILNKEYEIFPYTGGDKLDIALIASTIHYSVTTDLNQFEEKEGISSVDLENMDSTNIIDIFKQGVLDKKQTTFFYEIAKDKLGSTSTLVPGEKRLLGHVLKTEITLGNFNNFDDALSAWAQFLTYFGKSYYDTSKDIWEQVRSFLSLYREMEAYANQTGNALAGMEYDDLNLWYEANEFINIFREAFDAGNGQKTDENGNKVADENGWFWAPVVKRTMNYGYDEYKQMQRDIVEMKTILTANGVNYGTDADILNNAKDSSNTELKKLYEDYKKQESAYKYSYTHYLQEVYIPFTYFYKNEYTKAQIDTMIDEIFDQRDFYYYLMGEEADNYNCGGSCEYYVDGKQINNLKVRLLQCSDEELGKPIQGEELIDFEKYILGVVYAEIGPDAPIEAAKAQAIAARSYALLRPKKMGNSAGLKLEKENEGWILSIRNCVEDQVYCDPDTGCSASVTPTGTNTVTMYSGANTKTYSYKGALPEDSTIRSAVSAVAGKVLLDSEGNIVSTAYTNFNQNEWKKQAQEGMDYTEILLADYKEGSSISESNCSKVCNKATGDFTQWKQLASLGAPWANVVIGNGKTINQIGCLATSVAIQIARSGVRLQNISGEFNPGTFVEAIKPNGFVTSDGKPGGTLFAWDSSTIVAPTFKYSHSISLSGLTQTQKAFQVQELINQGCYVVMEVKGNGGGEHYVAIDYVQGDDVYMMDPASTEAVAWNQYPHNWTTGAYCYKVTS